MNSFPLFEDLPEVELLQWLARGSLKQNLLKGIRLWSWLRSLYGDEAIRVDIPDRFTYRDWRDAFFSLGHPKSDILPSLHDPICPCARSAKDWLFATDTGLLEREWRQGIQQQGILTEKEIDRCLQTRLFAVTRRSLAEDLKALTALGWLKHQKNQYYRVQEFPRRPIAYHSKLIEDGLDIYELGFLNPNLENIAQSLSQPIQGVQRFYLDVDYIIVQQQINVERWLELLRDIWSNSPVQPIALDYHSARYGAKTCIVYPTCVYYVQRAIYLCGLGTTPSGQGDWYNYRLDKIQEIRCLTWNDVTLPRILQQRKRTLPQPHYIRDRLDLAWGFDFYLPATLMLLRFDRSFSDRYIQGTFRHKTFTAISHNKAIELIETHATSTDRLKLLQIIKARCPDDAYYKVWYRQGDTNVGLRLRSWRPHIEILLSWQLRRETIAEMQAEAQFYQVTDDE
ncbi:MULTISPECIES: TIGR03985 family CRISPR-associated protein [Spirulina sp. CCY15215]|uniref:TIGR03985 family CRISPR-associated protein n=1 Tax=Spirulina sp. CCY15215 TaxID=2767591 RepID=UPI00194F5AD4|nr:TIGR03985 family CRISPR-associated protein [Spirulina major]